MFVVQPSVASNSEAQTRSGLFVASDRPQSQHIFRGIVLDIGAHLDEPNAEVGGVIHYSGYVSVGVGDDELHVVASQYALAFEAA